MVIEMEYAYTYMVRPWVGARWRVHQRTLGVTPRQFREIMQDIQRQRADQGASWVMLDAVERDA